MTEILYEEIYIWKAVVWRSWKFSKFYLCSERLSVLSPRLHPSMQRDQGGAQLWYLLTVWLAQYQRHRHLHGALNILGKNISQENVRWHWIGHVGSLSVLVLNGGFPRSVVFPVITSKWNNERSAEYWSVQLVQSCRVCCLVLLWEFVVVVISSNQLLVSHVIIY